MADSIHAWVDPRELRRIGELLLASPEDLAVPASEDAAYGAEFEGYERPIASSTSPAPVQISQATHSLAEAKRLAEEGGLLGSAKTQAPVVEAPTVESKEYPEAGPFLGRMNSFAHWLRNEVGVTSFFLLDHGGEVLLDEIGDEGVIQVARSLSLASQAAQSQSASPVLGSLRVKVSDQNHLEVLPSETYYGLLVLGLLVPGGLVPSALEIVAQGLQRAVEPPKGA